MSRPVRASRGQREKPTGQQEEKDNEVYEQIFGSDLDDEEDYINQKMLRAEAHNQLCQINLRTCSYVRGYHYFCLLTDFPRVEGHPSYVFDNNFFEATYSQQETRIGPSTVGELINRNLVGIPFSGQKQPHSHNDKNICHSYLYDNEDKKYNLDRTICTLRAVRKHLGSILKEGSLKKYGVILKNQELYQTLSSTGNDLEYKQNYLESKIQILLEKKESQSAILEYEDSIFLRLSEDQQLHTQIYNKRITQAFRFMFEEIKSNFIDYNSTAEPLNVNFFKAYTFYDTDQPILSDQFTTQLLNKHRDRLNSWAEDGIRKIILPSVVIRKYSPLVREKARLLLALKLNNISETVYYVGKTLWKNLLGKELELQREVKVYSFQQYLKLAKKKVQELKKNIRKKGKRPPQTYPFMDGQVCQSWEQQQQIFKHCSFFKGYRQIVSTKELHLLILFGSLCQALEELVFYLQDDNSLLEIVASEHYQKMHWYMVQALHDNCFASIPFILNSMCECIGGSDPQLLQELDLNERIFFYPEAGAISIERQQQQWETDRDENGSQKVVVHGSESEKLPESEKGQQQNREDEMQIIHDIEKGNQLQGIPSKRIKPNE